MITVRQIGRRYRNFIRVGHGKNPELTEAWESAVVVRHTWWSEYGGAPDPFELPQKLRTAHLAILEGMAQKREEENKKAEREASKAKRKA